MIGLIPIVGDLTDMALNYTLVLKPAKRDLELPDWLVRQMFFNNAVSAGVGFIPLAGDIILAIWRANSRNAKLLEEFLRVKGEENMANGLPNLTPHTDERGRPIAHPAQNAAREVAREGSAGASTGAGTAVHGQNETVQTNAAAPSTTAAQQPQTQTKRKWWGGANKTGE